MSINKNGLTKSTRVLVTYLGWYLQVSIYLTLLRFVYSESLDIDSIKLVIAMGSGHSSLGSFSAV